MKIILASSSPQKRKILALTGIKFSAVPSNFREDMLQKLSPDKLALHISRGKAEAVAVRFKNAIVIGADTFLVFGKKIIGKPKSIRDAKQMLRQLSGKCHIVITGFTIINTANKKSVSRTVKNEIFFRKLSPSIIKRYVNAVNVLDKAGAYAIQDHGFMLIEKIKGDYFNIVGLPLDTLLEVLKKFGLRIK